jgi:hypothetical protein
MKCSICNGDLERGYVEIHGTLTGFLFLGLSHQPLFYHSENDEKEEQVLEPNLTYCVFRCSDCKAIVMPNIESTLELKDGKCQICDMEDTRKWQYCEYCRQKLHD